MSTVRTYRVYYEMETAASPSRPAYVSQGSVPVNIFTGDNVENRAIFAAKPKIQKAAAKDGLIICRLTIRRIVRL